MPDTPEGISEFYGDRVDELSKSMFVGGFLNFGYWDERLVGKKNNLDIKAESGRNLYRRTLDELDIVSSDKVLEIGCGKGHGAALAISEYKPAEVHGVDAVDRQVERAEVENFYTIQEAENRLIFRQASANNLPYGDDYFSKILSVEATPHFPDLREFVRNVTRVTHNSGRIAVASIFSPSRAITSEDWADVLSYNEVPHSMVRAHPVAEFAELLGAARWDNINIKRIGEYVWRGFDNYLDNLGVPQHSNRRKWILAYETELLDYYIVTADLRQINTEPFPT